MEVYSLPGEHKACMSKSGNIGIFFKRELTGGYADVIAGLDVVCDSHSKSAFLLL